MQNKIRKLRKEMGMTQNDLAKAAQLTQATISDIECHVHEPSLWSAYRLSLALNTAIEELFDFEGDCDGISYAPPESRQNAV